jgi:DNA-binding CsgD family transcriptional regulator
MTSSFISALYDAVLDQRENYAQWALSAVIERLPLSQARWAVVVSGGTRELGIAGSASQPRTGEFTTLSMEVLEPVENLLHQFTWQRSVPATFTEEECTFLSDVLKHVVHGERLSRRLDTLINAARGNSHEPIGFAIVNANGAIESADRTFEDYLRRAVDHWPGTHLPFKFKWEPRLASSGLVAEGLFFRIDRAEDKFHVRVRKDRRQLAISNRELTVAQRLAAGLTFKEIAREVNLAPSTVSTHAYNLYSKLGFRRKAELVEWVHQNPALFSRMG